MTNPNSLNLKQLRQLVQTTVETITELHQVLNVVNPREINSNHLKESHLSLRQIPTRQQLQQVTEVVPAVERHPVNILIQHNPRRHQKLRESPRIDAVSFILIEIDPGLAEQLDGVVCEDVGGEVELAEVELPDAVLAVVGTAGREVSSLVGEREAELDHLEQVDVRSQGLVVVLGVGFESSDRSADDPGELGVHRDEREVVDDVANQSHF